MFYGSLLQLGHSAPVKAAPLLEQLLKPVGSQGPLKYLVDLYVVLEAELVEVLDILDELSIFGGGEVLDGLGDGHGPEYKFN